MLFPATEPHSRRKTTSDAYMSRLRAGKHSMEIRLEIDFIKGCVDTTIFNEKYRFLHPQIDLITLHVLPRKARIGSQHPGTVHIQL